MRHQHHVQTNVNVVSVAIRCGRVVDTMVMYALNLPILRASWALLCKRSEHSDQAQNCLPKSERARFGTEAPRGRWAARAGLLPAASRLSKALASGSLACAS